MAQNFRRTQFLRTTAASFPNHPLHAYLRRNGEATDLGSVDRDGCSWARAINARGQIVGQSFACDVSTLHTFLWENGSMVDLNSLIPANSNLQLVDTRSINDRGEIAGVGLPPGCTIDMDTVCGHAFVLIPCDAWHVQEVDCESQRETVSEIPTAVTQSNPINRNPPTVADSNLTPEEIATRIRARLGRQSKFLWSIKK